MSRMSCKTKWQHGEALRASIFDLLAPGHPKQVNSSVPGTPHFLPPLPPLNRQPADPIHAPRDTRDRGCQSEGDENRLRKGRQNGEESGLRLPGSLAKLSECASLTPHHQRELRRWQSSVIVTIDLDRNAHFLFAGRYESQQQRGSRGCERGWWAARGRTAGAVEGGK